MPGQVYVEKSGNDLILRITDSEDRIRISQPLRNSWDVIEQVRFAEGTVWFHADLVAMAVAETPGITLAGSEAGETLTGTSDNDTLSGLGGDDTLEGEADNDTLDGGAGNDILIGGTGDDTLRGGLGDDIYHFARGDGQDTITETGGYDRLIFASDIAAADVRVWQSGTNDLILHIVGTGDRVTLLAARSGGAQSIDSVEFADGTVWSREELIEFSLAGDHRNNIIYGTEFDEAPGTLPQAGLGISQETDRSLDGGAGSDTIYGQGGNDRILGGEGNDTLFGGTGNDELLGGLGRDTIAGDAGNDIIEGGQGADTLSDSSGDETYRYNIGDGRDTIADAAGFDRVEFGAAVDPDALVVTRTTTDLIIAFPDANDRLTILGAMSSSARQIERFVFADGSELTHAQMAALAPFTTVSDNNLVYGDDADTIFGTRDADTLNGAGGNDNIDGGEGNDTLRGDMGNDILYAGRGNDALDGGAGDDIYRFERGDNFDTIIDASGYDRLIFGADIAPDDVVVRNAGSGNLAMHLSGRSDRVTLLGALATIPTTVETVEFEDGTIWDLAELRRRSLIGGVGADTLQAYDDGGILIGDSGNDILRGGAGADTIKGGIGNDQMEGGAGSDLYIYTAGDGSDVINDTGADAPDTLRIHGFDASAIRFSRTGASLNDLTIRFIGSHETIVIANGGTAFETGVEFVEIADSGVVLTKADILAMLVPDRTDVASVALGSAGADSIVGTSGNDILRGGAGADALDGGDGDDIFIDIGADADADTYTGGAGRDLYLSIPGKDAPADFVADTITDFAPGAGGDVIRIASASPNPFVVEGLRLIQDGADTLIARQTADGALTPFLRLLGVDRTALTAENFEGLPVSLDAAVVIAGDDGNTVSDGGPLDDILGGGDGNDVLRGYAGRDRISGGADNDTLDGGFDNDLLSGGQGNDVLIGGQGSDILSGGSGDDLLIGFGDGSNSADNDVMRGDTGDDRLEGGYGNDTYVFARGDGQDVISDLGGIDTIEFTAGVTAADITVFQVDQRHIELRIAGSQDRILIENVLMENASRIERVQFADGGEWSWADIETASLKSGSVDDELRVPLDRSGNLLINGSFDDFDPARIRYTNSWGYSLRDIPGWTDANNYLFELFFTADGYALDIEEYNRHMDISQTVSGLANGETVALSFDANLPSWVPTRGMDVLWNGSVVASFREDVPGWFTTSLLLTAQDGDNTLRFRAVGSTSPDSYRIDNVELVTIETAASFSLDGGAGNDHLLGGDGADTLRGGSGNDRLEGGLGADDYVFSLGDGQDIILDDNGANRLLLGAGISTDMVRASRENGALVLRIEGSEDRIRIGFSHRGVLNIATVVFADGTEWSAAETLALAQAASEDDDTLIGDEGANILSGLGGEDLLQGLGGNDTLDGGAGSDRLEGGAGDDVYHFARGGGHDVIADSSGYDALIFADGISPGDIAVEQNAGGTGFVLRIRGEDARISVADGLGSGKVEEVRFADGTVWNTADLVARSGTFGNDTIAGDETGNVIEGGLGDDLLRGGVGNDTYRFTRGDGSDVIYDKSNSIADRLEISGYSADGVSFQRRGGDSLDIAITFAGSDDRIIIVDGLSDTAGIETISLGDGTNFTIANLQSFLLLPPATSGNDVLIGSDGADAMAGDAGHDLIEGATGADLYTYRRGDGDDRIAALGGGADRVILADYSRADVLSLRRGGPDNMDLVVTFANPGDRLVLIGALSAANGPAGTSVTLEFADGALWDRDEMRAQIVADTDGVGDDNVFGFGDADVFAAQAGNDLLVGDAGHDIYEFGTGSGHDTIDDRATSAFDTLRLVGITSDMVSGQRLFGASDTIVLHIAGNNTDSLTIVDALSAEGRGIENYYFADGVTWGKAEIAAMLDNSVPSIGADGVFSVTSGVELVISAAVLLANDFDADGDPLRIVAVDGGDKGVATLDAAGNIHYTAIGGFFGPASIAYTISDGRNGFDDASVDVRVRPVATAYDDTGFTVAEDGNLVIRVERLLSNDLDGDRMVVGQVLGAVNGTASLSSDGNISFTPNANFNGQASFTYVANTPEGGRAEARVLIDVTAVNDAPVARTDSVAQFAEGSTIVLDPRILTANDSDVDGDALFVESVVSNANVQVTIGDDGLITVAPRDYYWGAAYFDYVVSDGQGGTATGRVNFTVTPVNDAPELADDLIDKNQDGSPILEDNPIVIAAEQLLANDIEHDGDVMTITGVAHSTGGQARLLDNGTILFEPSANFNGNAQFDYRVDDGHGGVSWARATIVYQPVNDRPVARDDNYTSDALPILRGTEDTPLTIPIVELLKNDYDIEGFAVSFESAGNAINGDIVVENGNIVFTPDQDFWGVATFSYLVSDPEGLVDSANVTLWFENVGDAPPEANTDTIYVYEDIPTVITIDSLLANDTDVDRDPLTFLGWGPGRGGLNGTLEYDAEGNLLFTPDRDATRSGGFTYTITDNADGEATGDVRIVIVPSNDDPTVGEDFGFVTPLDVPLVIRVSDLLANDYDIEQLDTDGDGKIDVDLDNPSRAFPDFVGVDGVYGYDALQLGNRVEVGTAEVIDWQGEQFVVIRFPEGFSGQIAIEYRIRDEEGAEDVGFANANVADYYSGTLSGTPDIDFIEATNGTDIVRGLNRADWIVTLDGDDVIEAGLGDDLIEAGAGNDIIAGGDGADRIDGGTGYDTVTFLDSDIGVRADLEARVGQGGFAQGDIYLGIEALIGSAFNDQLGGDVAGNRLEGGAGRDILEGRGGSDILLGGAGDDTLIGGAGADQLDGGEGTDTASYELSAAGVVVSLVTGTASGGEAEGDSLTAIENVIGSDFDDQITGDDGDNVLSGKRGDDILIGGAGNDTLIGGRGADVLRGGAGTDIADYTLSAEGVTIDMIDGSAGGGDALGDTFFDIEIVQGSYHDDIIRGDDGDNRIRGGRGADVIDGRGGFDIADYSLADEAVEIDLEQGIGLAGEALGDTLSGIEMLVGSVYDDVFTGSAADETFQGGFGKDVIAGGFGSDSYVFGIEGDEDIINEMGAASDIDRILLDSTVAPKDVSILRDGDDLFLEFERDDGFLIDTIRVTNHFLGRETGIEEIVFQNGTMWDVDTIDLLQRVGRFNAADDIVRFAREDEPIFIDPAFLIENDAEDITGLTFVGIDRGINGTATVNADGMIEFLGAPNHNGDAFFYYVVRDEYGRESSARVEVSLAPVNDAPTAVDDDLVTAAEDVLLRIRIDTLLANDWDIDGDNAAEGLHIVGIKPLENIEGDAIDRYRNIDYDFAATNMSGSIKGDYLEFRLKPDYFGAAGFQYVLADKDGATSTATVEVYVTPVNDAPRAHDKARTIRLSSQTSISVADLLANTYDIEGDAISFVGLYEGADLNAVSNGTIEIDPDTGDFLFTADTLGAASIEYQVIDERGAAATLVYKLFVKPDNDAPVARNDYGFRTLEDQLLIIDPATLLANDSDENGDVLFIDSIARFADNGKVRFNEEGLIEFAPKADFNGSAGFEYTVSDGRGGLDTAFVSITILPRNEAAILRDDLVAGLEDGPLFVIPGEAFGNDVEPDGDVLFFERAHVLGVIDHRWLSPDFTVEARMADGSALVAGLEFDVASMIFTGTLLAGETAEVDVWLEDPANGRIFNTRITLDETNLAGGFHASAAVLEGYEVRSAHTSSFEFGADRVDAQTTVSAQLADGSELPAWLMFDAAALIFTGTPPQGDAMPIEVSLLFTRPDPLGGADLTFVDNQTIDPAELTAGPVHYDSDVALFDLSGATVTAQINGGRDLPDWLTFDNSARQLALSGFEPDADAQPVRVQIVFTPPERVLAGGVYASTDRGFALEFVIDPAAGIDPAINTILSGTPFFSDQGLFAIDLSTAASLSALRESGAPLNDWLTFDAETLSFAGTPPPEWVGALPVRLDIAAGGTVPAMSVITEVIIDDTFRLNGAAGIGLRVSDERITLDTPEDFNGTVVFNYDASDEKGAVSHDPARIFFNVRPTRERPDPGIDLLSVDEGFAVQVSVASLLANDFDADGDAVRIAGLATPANGSLTVELGHMVIAPPAGLEAVEGAIFSATLADGSELPSWLSVDATTGVISGDVPLDMMATLAIEISRDVAGSFETAVLNRHFDGNADAFITYTPDAAYSGKDSFTYTLTDDREGISTGQVQITVNPLEDPPAAYADILAAIEDTPLVIDPAALLANDVDVDDDPIRFLDVANAAHGTVSYDGTNILFTPDANFSGKASFEYTVTDDRNGVSTGHVTVNVASTNQAPVAGADTFATEEDVPFTFSINDLLANDSDPDGDAFRFESISRSAAGARIVELTGGRFQLVPDENVNGPVVFNYTISDGRARTTQTITFNIAAVNDAPIANDDFGFVTDMDVPLSIDFAALLANDRDVEGDTFSVVEVFDGDQGFVVQDGDTAIFTPDGGYFGDAGFHYRVTDEHGQSSVGYVEIIVYPDFPLPVASSDTGLEMLEDGYIDIDPAMLMANDTAPEGSTLSFVTLQGAELLENGRYRYTAQPDFFGEVTLRYAIENEQGFPVWSTVTIDVLPVEDVPVALDDTLETREDAPLLVFRDVLLANDSDADPQAIFIAGFGEMYGLSVVDIGNGQLEISPDENFNGSAWFDYTLSDSTGLTDTARVNVWVEPENDPPVINLVPIMRGLEDEAFYGALPAGFATDPDGDILSISVRGKDGTALPDWLTYDGATRSLAGQPPADFNGSVVLEVVASDGEFDTVRELIVSIEPVNDAPVIGSGIDDIDANEDNSFAMALRSDAFADIDSATLDYTLTLADGSPAPDWIVFDGNVVKGTPPANFNGTIALVISASDGEFSVSEAFALNIAPENDAPVVANHMGDAIYAEDTAISLAIPAGTFADVDGDALVLTAGLAGGEALPAWLSFDGERFSGIPPQDFNGELSVEVNASDGEYSASTTFALIIAAVNDAPAVLVPLADLAAVEDTPFSIALPTDGIVDVDGDILDFNVTLADGESLPEWLHFTGTALEGTPPPDFNGTIGLLLVASDGELRTAESFALSISAVNDAPVLLAPFAGLNSAEDAPIAFDLPLDQFADVDGDMLAYSLRQADGSDLPAWLSFDAETGQLSGTPPVDFNGPFDLVLTASDGLESAEAPLRLTIDPVNDGPLLLVPLADISGVEDTPISFAIPANTFGDIDGDSLAIMAMLVGGMALPEWLLFDGTNFTATPPENFDGAVAITITASDDEYSASDTFVLSFAAVNDAPVLTAPLAALSSEEDVAFSFAINTGSFIDLDGDLLGFTLTLADGMALPAWLQFGDGQLFGIPPADFNGTLALKLTASDGEYTASGAFNLAILPVNDAPVNENWFAAAVHTPEDYTIDLALPEAAFADIDGDVLTLTATLADGSALPEWLYFDGSHFTGTPPKDFNGRFDIIVTADDGLATTSAQFALVVDAINDAPVVLVPLEDAFVAEDHAINLLIPVSGFGDVDSDALSLSARLASGAELPAWLSFDGARLTGTPPKDFNGVLDIEVLASDGRLATGENFRLEITPVNDAPVVLLPLADLMTAEDKIIDLPLPVSGFADVDGDALTFVVEQSDGSALPDWLSFDGARLTGVPPLNFNGILSLRMRASDGEFEATDVFQFTIVAVNDAPQLLVPLADLSSPEDTAFAFAIDASSFGDVDGDILTLSARLQNGGALPSWMSFDGTTLSGTPPQDFNGTIGLEITASDGLLIATSNFVLAFDPVNDAPILLGTMPDTTVYGGEAIDWAVPAALFADIDGDTLSLSASLADGSELPSWIIFDGTGFSGTVLDDFDGLIEFAITASDGEYSATATFSATIIDPNDAPLAVDDGLFIGVQSYDLTILRSDLLANDSDPDGDVISLISLGSAGIGSVAFDADGNIVYSVDSTFVGNDTFTYTISDGSEEATATVTVRMDSLFEGWSEGSSGDDKLFGNNKEASSLSGGTGDDHIKGGQLDDRLAGGEGDDKLQGLSGDDQLWGNSGNDELIGNGGYDTAFYFGLRSTYVIQTVSGTVQVVDTAPSVDGDDGTDIIAGVELLSFKNGATASVVSPIILDLSGDGIETVSAADSNARFDLDGDGLADDTSWIGADEAFLYYDRNGDGTMSGVEEISFIDDLEGATTDLAGLAAFDSNGDGELDAGDEKFSGFGVWRDADGDGAVDEGETASLSSVGIASLGLAGTAVDGTTQFGEVAIINSGTFTLVNGTTRGFADAALTYFSAATNVPELNTIRYDVDRKASKYGLQIINGTINLVPKKPKYALDPGAGRLGANTLMSFDGKTYGIFAPVVLDLDGDGVELLKRTKTRAGFDYDADGAGDDTGWVKGDDGFLVIDRNNDGLITEAAELSLASEFDGARSGLQGLAWLDSNNDGVVDQQDARFGELRVWQDRNSNGDTDEGELRSLTDAGIASISLSVTPLNYLMKLDNNAVVSTTAFTRLDGTTATAADVSLAYRPNNSSASGIAHKFATILASRKQRFEDLTFGGFADAQRAQTRVDFSSRLEAMLAHLTDAANPNETPGLFAEMAVMEKRTTLRDRLREKIGARFQTRDESGLSGDRHTQIMPLNRVKADDEANKASIMPDRAVADDVVNRLAMIRQDLAAFGARGQDENGRVSVKPYEFYDWYS